MAFFIAHMRRLFSPQDKWKFIFITAMMAFSALLELLGIGILLGAATIFLAPQSESGMQAARILEVIMPWASAKYRVVWAILAIGVMLTAKNLFALLVVNIQAKFIHAKRNELAQRLYTGFLRADYESFSRLSPDFCYGSFFRLQEMINVILMPSMQILADFMVIILLSATAVVMFPVITISGVCFMAFTALAISFFTRRANRKCGEKSMELSLIENRHYQAGIAGEKTIKCAVKEDFFQQAFAADSTYRSAIAAKLYTLGQLPRLSLESASVLLACAVFAIMVIMDVEKSQILFTFAILTAAIGRILPALSRCNYTIWMKTPA